MKRQPSIGIIFLTVFLDLVGFGIVLPLLPVFSEEMGASGFVIGVIMASFSLMQFIFAPWWGKLSDRVGRRPVLLVSLAFSALSYAIFAIGSGMTGEAGLWVLLGSRVAAGICGANISVAQAYIADITPPENRSKRMGLIGMAFGLGFIFGPVLGGLSLKWFGVTGPGWVATAFCAVNFLLALAILPESWKPNGEHAPRRPRLAQWMHTLSQPKVGLLIWLFFLATFAFTCFETTLGLLVAKNFGLHPKQDADKISYLFTYCGLIGALVQGGAVGRLVRKYGEPGLIALSLGLTAAALAPMPFVSGWPALLAVLAVLSIGSQLARPPIFGMISNLTPPNEQGATLGVAQSIGSLARIAGPIFAGSLFKVSPAIPYIACAAVAALAGVIAWQRLHNVPRQSPASLPAEAA